MQICARIKKQEYFTDINIIVLFWFNLLHLIQQDSLEIRLVLFKFWSSLFWKFENLCPFYAKFRWAQCETELDVELRYVVIIQKICIWKNDTLPLLERKPDFYKSDNNPQIWTTCHFVALSWTRNSRVIFQNWEVSYKGKYFFLHQL